MAKDIRHRFAKRLRVLRMNAELTQEELSKKAGISVKYLQNLESSDPKNPTLLTLEKISTGLGIGISKLIDD